MNEAKKNGRADRMNGINEMEAAVRAVCPDWAELSEHQRERTREIFAAGAAWGRLNFATEVTENTDGERK